MSFIYQRAVTVALVISSYNFFVLLQGLLFLQKIPSSFYEDYDNDLNAAFKQVLKKD